MLAHKSGSRIETDMQTLVHNVNFSPFAFGRPTNDVYFSNELGGDIRYNYQDTKWITSTCKCDYDIPAPVFCFLFFGSDIPKLLGNIGGWFSLFFVVVVVIYDNVQAAYLNHLVFNKKKEKKEISSTTIEALKQTVYINFAIISIDWFSCGLYGYLIIDPDQTRANPTFMPIMIICQTNSSFHVILLMFLLQSLKKLTFAETKLAGRVSMKKSVDRKSVPSKDHKLLGEIKRLKKESFD
ncbi:hypothetical protein HDV04_005169 [Boothiomyces sp. JEL0838]|nr:hypothetical protein HDV04_005169 [Boothiomyces sp. JEL0838]